MSRLQVLSDEMWERIESLMPVPSAKGGRPFRDHRLVVEAIVWRYRTGSPWWDLPAEFGPWQTVWRRHTNTAKDGMWDAILAEVLTLAAATNLARDTGGTIELQEFARGACWPRHWPLPRWAEHQDSPLVDGAGMPLVMLTAPGQAGDAPMFPILMTHLKVATSGPGRARTRPDKVRGD
jgi:transposase